MYFKNLAFLILLKNYFSTFLADSLLCFQCDSRKIGSACIYDPPPSTVCTNKNAMNCVITKFLNEQGNFDDSNNKNYF